MVIISNSDTNADIIRFLLTTVYYNKLISRLLMSYNGKSLNYWHKIQNNLFVYYKYYNLFNLIYLKLGNCVKKLKINIYICLYNFKIFVLLSTYKRHIKSSSLRVFTMSIIY